ncbi:hypothetical protein AVEN_91928-1 [Araneus ventricosus]|uniref:Uncharacterized protein n=1 Tax=Araneus ventricosus TaxID=182803 RepID=A0A4Y2JDH5_ARAVE|nr:hypothetical protein AVEN_91928-1 [Araneus ventricosus]
MCYLGKGWSCKSIFNKTTSCYAEKEVFMQEHLNEVNELVNQLKSCHVKNSDVDIIVYTQPSEHISLQFVVSRLLDAEGLLKDRRVSETKAPRSESSNDIPDSMYTCSKFDFS